MSSVISEYPQGGGPMRPLPAIHWTSPYRDPPALAPAPQTWHLHIYGPPALASYTLEPTELT